MTPSLPIPSWRAGSARPIFWLIVFALLPALGAAQVASTGTISGRVYNPASQEYVRNAEVRLQGPDRLVTTESDGSFTLTNVSAGPVTLAVSYTGYNTATEIV